MAKQKKDGAAPKRRGRPPKDKTKQEAAPETPARRRSPASANDDAMTITATDLLKLTKAVLGRDEDKKLIGSTAKELVDKAAETKHLDKPAFGMVKKLYKMGKDNPEKLAVTLPALLQYIDDLKLLEIADDHAGLPLDNPNEGQVDIEEAISDTPSAKRGLSIVPGPNAPTDVPPAPDESEAA